MFYLVILTMIIISFAPSAGMAPQLSQDAVITEPMGFYQVSPNNDLPPVNPLGVKEDAQGNIHSWYFYISDISRFSSDQLLTLYYQIAFQNGTNLVRKISVETTSTTKFAFLQKQPFVETSDGGLYIVFIQSTDFGISLIKLDYHPDTGITGQQIKYEGADITGALHGPVRTDNGTEFYTTVREDSTRKLLRIQLQDGQVTALNTVAYPTVQIGAQDVPLADIFDIAYANGSIFYLGSVARSSSFHSLELVKTGINGTTSAYAERLDVNMAPVLRGVEFYSAIRQDLIKPQLVSTTNGKLYSFLFSLSQDNQINALIQWKPGNGTDVFADAEEDPFLISFLPTISAVGNTVKIASLGIQIAQDIFTVAIDYYSYDVVTAELRRDKIQSPTFSTGFFFFTMDFTSDSNLGLAGTISIPTYLQDDYDILNNTVGAVILFSNSGLPDVDPYFHDVSVKQQAIETTQKSSRSLIIIIIGSVIILGFLLFIYWRLSILEQVKIDQFHDQDSSYRQSGWKAKLINFLAILGIHLRSNWRRYAITTVALIIPVLLLLSLFTGLLSHQDYLMHTYEAQNPLNDATNGNVKSSDFEWKRSLYDDEYSNNTITNTQWGLGEQLTSTVLQRNGVANIVSNISATTVFPLFEKRLGYFINDQGKNQSVNYPFGYNLAVIDPTWYEYFTSNLEEGRLPTAPNEVLIHEDWYIPRDLFGPQYEYGNIYDVGDQLKLYASELDIYLNSSIAGLSQNLTIVGKVQKVENQPIAEVEEWAQRLGTTVKALRYLDQIPIYTNPLLTAELLNKFTRLSLRPVTHVNLRYDVFSLERDEIPPIIDHFKGMQNRTFQETGIPWQGTFVDNRIIDFLEGYFTASNNIQLEATVIVIPVLGLLVLLNYESLGIGRSSLEEEISRHKQEGMRTERLVSLFAFERFVATGVAVAMATAITPLVTPLFLQFTGFFQTNARTTPPMSLQYLLVISLSLFVFLWLIGIILSLGYFMKVEDWRYQRYVSGFKGDLVIVIIAAALIALSAFISNVFEEQLTLSTAEDALNSNIELIFLSIRMISLLLGTFGAVLIFSKVLNFLFISIGKLVWKTKRSRKTLAFNGISSSMGVYGKLLIILTIAFFLIVPMVVVPQSLQAQYTTDAYGKLGTDIIGSDWNTISSSVQEKISEIPDVTTVSPYFFGILEFGNNLRIRTLAIDPESFTQAVDLPKSYQDKFGISPAVYQTIAKNEIITNQAFIQRNPVSVGDIVELGFNHVDTTVNLLIKQSFKEFPILKYEMAGINRSAQLPLQMVMSMDTLNEMLQIYQTNATESTQAIVDRINHRNVLIDAAKIDEVAGIVGQIRQLSGMRMSTINDYIIAEQHPFFRIFEFVSHLSIIAGLLAPLLSTFIFSNILFERRKFELEVYVRNGLSNSFFVKQLSAELLMASLLPSLAGLLLGSIWSALYGTQLFGTSSNNIVWQFNGNIILGYTIIILVASLAIWVFQMFRRTHAHIREVRL